MDRELYERTELEIFRFQTEDVITTSAGREEDELNEKITPSAYGFGCAFL